MEVQNTGFLKDWRENLGISQKRFAELAGVSLTTLRQFETGSQKPQQKTLKKLTDVMQKIDSGALGSDALKPSRKRRKGAVAPITETAQAPEVIAPTPQKRRGRPPRKGTPEATPSPQQTAKPAPPAAEQPALNKAVAAPSGSGVIQLSNLDLELINRILNMSPKEKLALLSRLM